MIEINKAIELINNYIEPFSQLLKSETIAFCDAHQQNILENIIADRGNPPFHRVAMDGIAICSKSFIDGRRKFPIIGIQKAGSPVQKLEDLNACFEVMTGSVLPDNTDAVIPYEKITVSNHEATINAENIEYLQNIHQQNSDYNEKDVLVYANTTLTAPKVGILASVGKNKTIVKSVPKIAIVSTGDELVDVDKIPDVYQIRRSNSYALKALLQGFGFPEVHIFHIPDNQELLYKEIKAMLEKFDCILLSGGVSMGKFDLVPEVLYNLNVQKVFHKIAQKPGKPMWFGVSSQNKLVFGLPGNPVSVLVCARRYVIPALLQARGSEHHLLRAILTEEIRFPNEMTLFKPVAIEINNTAQIMAKPIKMNGSGDFASLGNSDGFIELSKEKNIFLPGEVYPLYLWTRTFYGNAS